MKIYVAGNSRDKTVIQDFVQEFERAQHNFPIEVISSWHRLEGIPETPTFARQFWKQDQQEIGEACLLLVYLTQSLMKGALVEIGMALQMQKSVILFGELNPSCGSWRHHSQVFHVTTKEELEKFLQLASLTNYW